ncbi:MAG: biotin/lipoyl-containing protein, partial [Actinomycetes bacterium]
MPTLLRMPAVAANESDTLLSSWLVESGGSFTAGQAIAVVETEKAAADVEADADGVLVRTLVAAGTNVEVGDPIALLAEVGETVSDIEAALVELGVTSGAAP